MANQYLPGVIVSPSSLLITNITNSERMIVSVTIGNPSTEVNTYIIGMAVKLFVPKSYGMYQANNLVGTIIDINVSDFTLNIESTLFDAFVIPSGNAETPASISPSGSRNLQYNNYTRDVPFKSFNNIGN